MGILNNFVQKDLDKVVKGVENKTSSNVVIDESDTAQEAIDWLKKEINCNLGKQSGSEQWMTCPSCKDSKVDNFSINLNNAKWHCQKCKIGGQGLEGPRGLKAQLGHDYKSVPTSHGNQNAKTAEKEKKKMVPISPDEASRLLIPAAELLNSDNSDDEHDRGMVDDFIEMRNYDKQLFCTSFDVRIARKDTVFPEGTFRANNQYKCYETHLVWCQTDDNGNIIHMMRRTLGEHPTPGEKHDTSNCIGAKRIYLSTPPENPVTGRLLTTESITDGIALRHYDKVAVINGNSLVSYKDTDQLEIFRGVNVAYLTDADVPSETDRESIELLSQYASSIISFKAKQPGNSDNKYDWSDMLADGRDHLQKYIVESIKTATPFVPSQVIAEKEKKEVVIVEPVKRELQPVKPELIFPECAWRGLFDTYRKAQAGTTEAPDQYHFAVFKTVAGIIIGRTSYIWSGCKLFPNFYSIPVGPTKRGRKTTASKRGINLLNDIDQLVIVLRGLSTPEGMINQLQIPSDEELNDEDAILSTIERQRAISVSEHEGYRMLVICNEFASLLKKAKKESSSGIIQTLTDAYDCPDSLDVPTRRSPLSARKPVVSMIGLSTKSWLEANLDPDDLRGGFVNRNMFYLWTPTYPIPNPPKPDEKLLGQIIKQLHDIREIRKGKQIEYSFSAEAIPILERWYNENYHAEHENELIDDAIQRVDENVRKLALLYSILENETHDTEIHLDQLKTAIQVGEYWKSAAVEIFGKFGFSKQARYDMKLLELIQENQYTKRELQMRIGGNMSASEFNKTLNALVEAGRVLCQTDPNNKRRQILIAP